MHVGTCSTYDSSMFGWNILLTKPVGERERGREGGRDDKQTKIADVHVVKLRGLTKTVWCLRATMS